MTSMAEILKKDDFRRVELLNLVTKKGGMKNLNLDQLVLLDKLLNFHDEISSIVDYSKLRKFIKMCICYTYAQTVSI